MLSAVSIASSSRLHPLGVLATSHEDRVVMVEIAASTDQTVSEGSIQIIAMRSWGELGNLLAARTLAACLEPRIHTAVHVIEAETLFPRFDAIGRKIADIMSTGSEPEEKRRRYLTLMTQVEPTFPVRCEIDERLPLELTTELEPWVQWFSKTRPRLVIGTKGIISRLALAALRRAASPAPLLNFVTNQGLLTLPLHRSRWLPRHFVPFESARQYLLAQHGYAPDQVRTVGRLLAHGETAKFVERPKGASASSASLQLPSDIERRVVVFVNRGGPTYLEVLRALADSPEPTAVLFIGYNDPALVAAARELTRARSLTHWAIVERLGQGEYLSSLRWLSEGRLPILITKTGPNTVLEAAYFGVPQLLLRSGLPMEEWVSAFVEEHGFGRGFPQMSALVAELRTWLRSPEPLLLRQAAAKKFAADHLNQAQVERTLESGVRELLAARPAAARERIAAPSPV
jgi:hypothetical protein